MAESTVPCLPWGGMAAQFQRKSADLKLPAFSKVLDALQ
jgi:hypothetical protein